MNIYSRTASNQMDAFKVFTMFSQLDQVTKIGVLKSMLQALIFLVKPEMRGEFIDFLLKDLDQNFDMLHDHLKNSVPVKCQTCGDMMPVEKGEEDGVNICPACMTGIRPKTIENAFNKEDTKDGDESTRPVG